MSEPFSGATKIGPLPAWGWALGAGGLLGLFWFLRRPAKATGTDAQQQAPTSTGQPQTTVIPVDQGLSESQFKQLMAAIKKLQGQPSTTPPVHGGDPPKQPGGPITVPSPVPTPAPAPAPTPQPPQDLGTQWVDVHPGDSFASIAARYGKGWQELWNYQLQPGVRPASTQATLRSRGPDHALFNGSSVAIPGTWRLK